MTSTIDFAGLFEIAPNAYMVLDSELRYVAANAAYLEATASTREQLLGRHVFDLFPNDPKDPNNAPAQMLRKSLERVLASGEREHLAYIPYRVPRKAGNGAELEDRVWSATHCPVKGADGKVRFILQHTVDVTELQSGAGAARRSDTGEVVRSEAGVLSRARAVQEANARLDAEREGLAILFEQAPGFMCVLEGEDHVFRLANDAYLRLVGKRDLVGKPLRVALPEVVEQGFVELLNRVYRSGEPFVGDGVSVRLERTPGGAPEEAFVDFVYQPVHGPDGAIRGIFVQGHDVTARVRAEHESQAARRAAEAFSEELKEQSGQVTEALARAQKRIQELEAALAAR